MNLRVPVQPLRLVMMTLVGLVVPVIACGDSGSGTTATTTNASASSTGEPGTGTTVTTGASVEPTTTGATGETTTGVTTGMTTGMTTGATSTGATTGATEGGESGTTGGGSVSTGGGGEVLPCVTDEDCTLAEGCCDCEALNPGETVPECGVPECFQTHCSAIGLFTPVVECRYGVCAFQKQTCNPLGVDCQMPAPECGPGALPTVEDTNGGKCWTGNCVPAETCDWVPDCSYCDIADTVCVGKLQKGAYHVCEARPLDCGETDDIDCTCGQQICDASPPHTVCQDAADDIACECPFC